MTRLTRLDGQPLGRFAFGTMQFGAGADAHAARAMFDACRAAGICHFDTAHLYTEGRSEQILGSLIGADRDALFIASKIGYDAPHTPDHMRRDFEMSLQRLDMERVDLLYLHRDPGETLPAILDWLAQEQEIGRIRYIGLSNFSAWRVMKAQALAAARGTRVDALQPMYNLVKRQAEVEILPMCAAEQITAFCYSPLGGGLLTGKYGAGGFGRLAQDERYAARYADPAKHAAAQALAQVAQEIGQDPATLAAAWVAAHPVHPVPLLSARTPEQLHASLAAVTFDMTPELYARISALTPAPPPATDRSEEA